MIRGDASGLSGGNGNEADSVCMRVDDNATTPNSASLIFHLRGGDSHLLQDLLQ
jgi:hypothetical protein